MKHLLLILLALSLLACNSTNDVVAKREEVNAIDGCKDVPGLKWEYYERGYTSDEVLNLADKLVAAGRVDAELSEKASAEANASAQLESSLAQTIKGSVKQSSDVSDEFWEQEVAYQQTLCLLRAMQRDEKLTDEAYSKINDKILEFTSIRITYVTERKKKLSALP